MTEFWVSNAKYWCKTCKVWMQGDKMSIKKHESGRKHQELIMESKKEKREAKIGAAREEADLAKQMREIEKAAASAVEQDLASGSSRFSKAARAQGVSGRAYGGFAPPPPYRAPPPPPKGQPMLWKCIDCNKENAFSKAQCEKCGARRPSGDHKEGEEGEDDKGIYQIGEVTYMDGKRHEHKLERNTFAQIWLESDEEWVDCVIISVQAVSVAHTDVTLRTLSAAHYGANQPLPPTAMNSVEEFLTGDEAHTPEILSAVPPDKFRLVIDPTKPLKLPEKKKQEVIHDENTGFGGWETVAVVEVDDDEEEKKKERERVYLQKVAARKEDELRKEKERREQEDLLHADGDDAMSTYDPWNKGVYKGIVLEPKQPSSFGSRVPPPPPPPPRPPVPLASERAVGGWVIEEDKKRKLDSAEPTKHASSLEVSAGSSTVTAVFKKRAPAKKKFRSKQSVDE